MYRLMWLYKALKVKVKDVQVDVALKSPQGEGFMWL